VSEKIYSGDPRDTLLASLQKATESVEKESKETKVKREALEQMEAKSGDEYIDHRDRILSLLGAYHENGIGGTKKNLRKASVYYSKVERGMGLFRTAVFHDYQIGGVRCAVGGQSKHFGCTERYANLCREGNALAAIHLLSSKDSLLVPSSEKDGKWEIEGVKDKVKNGKVEVKSAHQFNSLEEVVEFIRDYDKNAKVYQEAYDVTPKGKSRIMFCRGLLCLKNSNLSKAFDCFLKAADLDKNNVEARVCLFQTLEDCLITSNSTPERILASQIEFQSSGKSGAELDVTKTFKKMSDIFQKTVIEDECASMGGRAFGILLRLTDVMEDGKRKEASAKIEEILIESLKNGHYEILENGSSNEKTISRVGALFSKTFGRDAEDKYIKMLSKIMNIAKNTKDENLQNKINESVDTEIASMVESGMGTEDEEKMVLTVLGLVSTNMPNRYLDIRENLFTKLGYSEERKEKIERTLKRNKTARLGEKTEKKSCCL
jgi:tetratricopeptide (TPR) repeat protein